MVTHVQRYSNRCMGLRHSAHLLTFLVFCLGEADLRTCPASVLHPFSLESWSLDLPSSSSESEVATPFLCPSLKGQRWMLPVGY